jgi:hypothetical protein
VAYMAASGPDQAVEGNSAVVGSTGGISFKDFNGRGTLFGRLGYGTGGYGTGGGAGSSTPCVIEVV